MGWVEMLCWVRILGRGCWGRDAQGGWGEDAALSDLYHSSIAGKAPSLREAVLRVPSFLKHKALPVTTPAMSPRSNLGLRRHTGGAGFFLHLQARAALPSGHRLCLGEAIST